MGAATDAQVRRAPGAGNPLAGAIASSPNLEAGAAALRITPRVETFEDRNRDGRWEAGEPFTDLDGDGRFDPVWLAGFGRGRLATGVHDELWARCLALRAGEAVVALVTLDLIGFTRDQLLQVREAVAPDLGIPAEWVLVSSSHTHHGPDMQGLWGPNFWTSGIDENYRREVRTRIVEVVRAAVGNLQPAEVRFATARVPGVVRDTRSPILSDERLEVAWLRSGEGESIAVLLNFGMHPEVLGRDNRQVSSDYVGPLRQQTERLLGGMALFVNADLGGMQTPAAREPSFAEAERIGFEIARAAAAAARGSQPRRIQPVSRAAATIELPMTNPLFHLSRWLGVFKEAPGLFVQHGLRVSVPCDLAALRIGEAVLVTVPGELFPELGEELRSEAGGEHLFILGLTNHSIGYIVPEEAWSLTGYEERVSLGRRTAPLLMEEWRKLIALVTAEAPASGSGASRGRTLGGPKPAPGRREAPDSR